MLINMNIGGTEKALISMLSEIDKEKYDVTVLMLEKGGVFLDEIPKWVNVKYVENFQALKPLINNPIHINVIRLFKNRQFIKSAKMFYLYLTYKITRENTKFFRYILKDYPTSNEEYDLAVAYAGPMDFISYFIINNIKSKRKIQWIHFDLSQIDFNRKFAQKIYDKFDKVFVVSHKGRKILIEILPSIKEKVEVFYNIISFKPIRILAEKENSFNDDFQGIRILTVGRLTHIKGQFMTIPVLDRLKKEGYNVRWYCIGEGMGRKECENLIKEYKVECDYVLLGSNSNPYPFMKDCDIYVQSSQHEGYCITLAEARCFDNPIVTTNFTGANEQIVNYENGLISEISEDALYEKLKKLLDDDKLFNKIKSNLKDNEVNTSIEIKKLYKCIN